jgi:chromosomal replication initiator protein
MHRPPLTFARFVTGPENRSALLAVQDVAAWLGSHRSCRTSPLFLHGPAGSGKTHLVHALVEEVTRRCPDLVVALLSAGDLDAPSRSGQTTELESEQGVSADDPLETARHSDLIVVEDLQHLPLRAMEPLVQLLDDLQARQRQVLGTALSGPQHLAHRGERFPARLTSRLACGLVVGLEPLQVPSRLALLQDRAQRRQLAVSRDVLAWLAEHLTGGGRQLEGALARLETLARLHSQPLDVATVASHFREQVEASAVTVERIAQRVSGYFRVEARQLQSRRRSRSVLLPRQVSMYLARQLTQLSLDQIGAYFGGRDHSTVLHACRKVTQAIASDPVLSGTVRQLHADLA